MNTVLSNYGQLCGCPEILKKSCKFFCRGLDIRVPKVMYPDPLNACRRCRTIQFLVQRTVGEIENAVPRLNLIKGANVLLHLVVEERRHRYIPNAVLRLRRTCSILAPHPVVRFIDASCTRGQYVRWCQSQAFPHSESKPIHQLKGDTISPF